MSISDLNEVLTKWPKLQYLEITESCLNKQLSYLEVQKCPILKEIEIHGDPKYFGAKIAVPEIITIDSFAFTPNF